jgi:hypothetical protein
MKSPLLFMMLFTQLFAQSLFGGDSETTNLCFGASCDQQEDCSCFMEDVDEQRENKTYTSNFLENVRRPLQTNEQRQQMLLSGFYLLSFLISLSYLF